MRQPLWIINTSLFTTLVVSQVLFLLLAQSIPRKVSLTPTVVQEATKSVEAQVDLKRIYGVNDLFGTYVPEVPVLVKETEFKIPEIPAVPSSIPLSIPVEKATVFIAPLAATLKGIVYLHEDQDKSMAIVQLDGSKQEQNYRVGELIQDAQILKIFPNRLIVVRSNGQQETLYLRETEAKKDFSLEDKKVIAEIKISFKDEKYYVPLTEFTTQVRNLGHFIDILDLTTVYQKGKSVGARVGKAVKESLGSKLGFEPDDVIKQIDHIAATDVDSRLKIYDHVISKKIGDTIIVQVQRGGSKSLALTYVLSGATPTVVAKDTETTKQKAVSMTPDALYDAEQQKKKILEQRVKLAPTARQIQMDEQKKLLEARRKNMLSNKQGLKS